MSYLKSEKNKCSPRLDENFFATLDEILAFKMATLLKFVVLALFSTAFAVKYKDADKVNLLAICKSSRNLYLGVFPGPRIKI